MPPTSVASAPSKPFTISFGSSKSKSAQAPPPKKRPHSALAEPDSDHEDETSGPQLVSAFDHSGAIVTNGGPKIQAPLVIQAERNRDWREESRKKRRKNLLPKEVQAAKLGHGGNDGIAHVERDEISKVSGIQFVQRDGDGDSAVTEVEAAQRQSDDAAEPPKSADDEALEALLGGEKKSTLTIPAVDSDDRDGYDASEPDGLDYVNEDERYRADVASRPDVATLDDYSNIPVDGFGSALLRGMGWKDGEAVGKRRAGAAAPKEPIIKERRPALLGIGAKEVPGGVGDEFGAWGKAAKGRRKTDLTYNPVLLKNSKTGELMTEEELAKKKEEQKNRVKEDDWRERRDRNLKIDQERKTERRDRKHVAIEVVKISDRSRNRDRDHEGEKKRRDRSRSKESRRRDRSRDSGRRRERSREGDRRKRDRSLETNGSNGSRYNSSRQRSRSIERDHHASPRRRDRSRSAERRHRRY